MPLRADGFRCDIDGTSAVGPREVASSRAWARRMLVLRLLGLKPGPAGVLPSDAGVEGTSGSSRGWYLRPSLDARLIPHRVELALMNVRISLGVSDFACPVSDFA